MKVTRRFRKMSEVYKIFAPKGSDLSETALKECFLFESAGIGNMEGSIFEGKNNGYLLGKKWLNTTVTMWKEDIQKRLLYKSELYKDKFPHWWLDKVLK